MNRKKFDPYIICLAFLTAVPSTAIDMLLSAIPTIAKDWSVTEAKVSLTISLFFVSLSIGLLFYGPLSDKYGRKPVLIMSTISFMLSSYLCSIATGINQLILFRVLQGFSAAGASTMSMAISRDKYEGKQRKIVLAYVAMIMAVAPMVAPTIGAYVLEHFQWQMIFRLITGFSIIPIIFALCMKETNLHKSNTNLFKTFLRYKLVLTNRSYLKSTLVLISGVGPFFAFIGFSSIAYISYFKLDEKVFGYLFAFNAICSVIGSLVIAKLVKRFKDRIMITCFYALATVASLLMLLFGSVHFMAFAIFMGLFTFSLAILRPMSNAIVLEQVDGDIGMASSFMMFYQFMIGAVYMSIATMEWQEPIQMYGLVSFVTMVILLISWIRSSKTLSHC